MKPRIRAFLIHLAASSMLALVAFFLVFCLWYSPPLDKAVGVKELFLLVLSVNVLVGPVLTLLVFKPGKKSLRFDLAVIALLQLSAFSYGVLQMAEGRPVWLVYNAGRFDLIQAYKIDTRHWDDVSASYRSPSWFGPRWVAAKSYTSIKERDIILFEAVFYGVDIPQRPDLYEPLAQAASDMVQHAKPLVELERYNAPAMVEAMRGKWPSADAYLPLMAKSQAMTVLIKKESAEIVAIADLQPWD